MSAQRDPIDEPGVEETAEAVVARIRKRGRTSMLPHPSQEAIRQFVARTAHEPVMSQEDLAAWAAEWSSIEQEMRERDHADDVAEGRAW